MLDQAIKQLKEANERANEYKEKGGDSRCSTGHGIKIEKDSTGKSGERGYESKSVSKIKF
jgi:hypothetical protein